MVSPAVTPKPHRNSAAFQSPYLKVPLSPRAKHPKLAVLSVITPDPQQLHLSRNVLHSEARQRHRRPHSQAQRYRPETRCGHSPQVR